MTIACPCYRLNGDLWYEYIEPSLIHAEYHLTLRDYFNRTGWSGFPPHAREACRTYADALLGLISAGF